MSKRKRKRKKSLKIVLKILTVVALTFTSIGALLQGLANLIQALK